MADNILQICSEVGLSCESCTAENARHVAAVCKGLTGGMVNQMFVQIYPNSACAPMHRHFAAHYRDAVAVLGAPAKLPVVLPMEPVPQRREVTLPRRGTMVAVA